MQRAPASFLLSGVAALLLLLGAGCQSSAWKSVTNDVVLTNLTPPSLPENPSGRYPILVEARVTNNGVVADSMEVALTIDGKERPMAPALVGPHTWEVDHAAPAGTAELRYFVSVNYRWRDTYGREYKREKYTDLQTLRIVNRYALTLDASRGPVGARIGIVGRGFQPGDTVHLDDTPAETALSSGNAIQFTVPAVEPNRSYRVRVLGAAGSEVDAGTFRVDPGTVTVSPSSLNLAPREKATVTVQLSGPAGPGGQYVDVTTDVPESVIMPELVVPAGARSASVPITGGAPGNGTIWFEVPGMGAAEIPVSVY